jgi:glycosyltransferase involved in cell wall biosynthesis
MRQRLAIVIPAFKPAFLDEALASIDRQTCRDFKLYVGDDASPADLYSIVKKYAGRLPVVYRRFEENRGGQDLVSQWERCIDMVEDEEWIWLFSDDDVMDAHCVELFYDALQRHEADLYHFDVSIIDRYSRPRETRAGYPLRMSAAEYFRATVEHRVWSFVSDSIFNRQHFLDAGRFQAFDLAWGSDHATWIKLGFDKGIVTVRGARVYWRASGENISSLFEDAGTGSRKVQASVAFFNWARGFFNARHCDTGLSDYDLLESFLIRNRDFFPALSNRFICLQIKVFSCGNRWLYVAGCLKALRRKLSRQIKYAERWLRKRKRLLTGRMQCDKQSGSKQ